MLLAERSDVQFGVSMISVIDIDLPRLHGCRRAKARRCWVQVGAAAAASRSSW